MLTRSNRKKVMDELLKKLSVKKKLLECVADDDPYKECVTNDRKLNRLKDAVERGRIVMEDTSLPS